MHVGRLLVSVLRAPQATAEQYCALMVAGDAKQLAKFFRDLLPKKGK